MAKAAEKKSHMRQFCLSHLPADQDRETFRANTVTQRAGISSASLEGVQGGRESGIGGLPGCGRQADYTEQAHRGGGTPQKEACQVRE